MGLLSEILDAVVTAASTIVNAAIEATVKIVDSATTAWEEYQKKQERDRLPEPERQKEIATDKLIEINNEIFRIRDRYLNNRMSANDKKRWHFLNNTRNELINTINNMGEVLVSKEISKQPNAFEGVVIDTNKAHIFQGQVGVSMSGKRCPVCNRNMIIQWNNNLTTANPNNFFWGCTGWYFKLPNGKQSCVKKLSVTNADLSIFARTDNDEAKTGNELLTALTLEPESTKIITGRMDGIESDQRNQKRGSKDYRCPVHGEESVLRKKQQPNPQKGLLDYYYLACPHREQGCDFVVKLKSAMQLSTFLRKETGSGIL
ncbi:MAG: hypothetical protein DRQ51_09190 [Gammaproteobacteria bacterium]|nr:MAG: hypothetical protein DRQ51_09190 [Gammaproteobacteria bacterium]